MAQTPNVIATVVLQRLRELDLPGTPENYERLYYEISGLPRPAPQEPQGGGQCKELMEALRAMVDEISRKTAHLTQDLGEKNRDLETSVISLRQSREKNEILRLLGLVVAQAGGIHSTVRDSHEELVRTRQALESMREELTETRQLLNEDVLTGTLNRRGLEQCLSREVARAQRVGEPLCLAMVDLDHFKRINDTHGHGAGDEMLRHFASLIKSVMRKSDAVVRYGGEEFVLVLPETDMRGAQFVLARLQQVMLKTPLHFEGKVITATFSAGVAGLHPEENGHALLRRADEALYLAKEGGRNRVMLAA